MNNLNELKSDIEKNINEIISDLELNIDLKNKNGKNNDKIIEKFKSWLHSKGIMDSSVNAYISHLNLASQEAIEDNILEKSIFEITDLSEIKDKAIAIRNSEKFQFRIKNSNNINSAALNHYISFIQWLENENNEKEKYTREDFLKEVFIDDDKYNSIISVLEKKQNIILEGAPGVGKTFMAKRLAYSILGSKDNDKIEFIQFHQNYSYEDFIEGFKPTEKSFELKKGLFYNFCKKAEADEDNNYYLIIDEINRGNLSKIFGELLMLIESDKRGEKITLAYSEEKFTVPKNVFIIGLMNTADRSLALIDYALRRRFSFIRIEPAFENDKFKKAFGAKFDEDFSNVISIIKNINKAIEDDKSLGNGFKIGHSYFCPNLKDRLGNKKDIQDIITYEILPLLEEYWYDDEDSLIQWENALNGVIND